MKLAYLPLCAAAAVLVGCASGKDERQFAEAATPPDWRSIATVSDRARLREWRDAWIEGLEMALEAGHNAAVGSEGTLLQPDAAVAWEDPPPGVYRCRTVKIGGQSESMLDYVAYPWFDCRIRMENGFMSFAKLSGSQRPIGLLLPYRGQRMVFLGTLQLGDEGRALQYGRDTERDMAGIIERIGEEKWRLVFPYPHFESTIDVIELVPKSAAS
jgi:hypothetical protein